VGQSDTYFAIVKVDKLYFLDIDLKLKKLSIVETIQINMEIISTKMIIFS
jgi:hypothetical protein